MVFNHEKNVFHLLAFNREMFLAPKAILESSRIAQSKSLSWNSESERLYCERPRSDSVMAKAIATSTQPRVAITPSIRDR